jgi:hypothetical protein
MKRIKKIFMVGYDAEGRTIYGKDDHEGCSKWADPMTLREARAYAKRKMVDDNVAIYKLVKVEKVK